MKIIDAIKHKGTPFEIPNCSRNELPEFFKERGYKIGAEIGVYKGEYTAKLLATGMKVYGVDPWGIFPDYPDNRPQYIDRQQVLYAHTMRTLKKYENFTPIRKISMAAVQDFEIESLDFVYIDGNHKFKYVAEDIYEWEKRVRPGGIIAGHDYMDNPATQIACKVVIDAYVKVYNIDSFYVLGEEHPPEGNWREKWRSWFWIKTDSVKNRKVVKQNDA